MPQSTPFRWVQYLTDEFRIGDLTGVVKTAWAFTDRCGQRAAPSQATERVVHNIAIGRLVVREIGARMEAIARAAEGRATNGKAEYEAQVARRGTPPIQASTSSSGQRSTSAYIVTTRGVPGY